MNFYSLLLAIGSCLIPLADSLHLHNGQWRVNTCVPCVGLRDNGVHTDRYKACDLFRLKRKLTETLGIVNNIMLEMTIEFPGLTFDTQIHQDGEENYSVQPLGFTIRSIYGTLQHVKLSEEVTSYLNRHNNLNINMGQLGDNLDIALCEVERILRSGSFHDNAASGSGFHCLVGSHSLVNCARSYSVSVNCITNFLTRSHSDLSQIIRKINQILVNF